MKGTTDNGSVKVKGRNEGTVVDVSVPDSEVLAKAQRRRFSAEYKLGVLEQADACREPGAIAALLRREGLYSSHLTEWRKARRSGALGALKQGRGPKGGRRDAVARENEQLRKENVRLRRRLEQAQTILDIQKKASEILGIPLNAPPLEDDE